MKKSWIVLGLALALTGYAYSASAVESTATPKKVKSSYTTHTVEQEKTQIQEVQHQSSEEKRDGSMQITLST